MHKAEVCPTLSTAVAPYDGIEYERTYRANHPVEVAWTAIERLQEKDRPREKLNQKIRERVRRLKYGVLANRNEWNIKRGRLW